MFYQYEIVNSNGEDVLYLYLNMKYEFAKDFSITDDNDLTRRTNNFIKSNNIKFRGNKIYLVVDGIIVKTLNINKMNNSIKNSFYSCDNYIIHLKLDDNSLCEITLREYLLSVLLSKYMDFITDEVFKAITILYNTYAYKMMSEEGIIYSTNTYAIYKPIYYYKSTLNNFDIIIKRLNSIIDEVDCIYCTYNNKYILPFIHYSNNGRTISNSLYPYLTSVKSLWDMTSPYYINIDDFTYEELSKKLGMLITSNSSISMIQNNNIKKLVINKCIYSLEEFRKILDLKSQDIYIIINSNYLRIISRGWGNFYGLSLYGAVEISKNGSKYYNILKYYFPKVKLFRYIKELS